jgi:DNA uptake protein ComE-like DNA-binding protein
MQRSKPYRPIFDSSLHSTRRSASLTALRASGHRTATQAGHHVKTIESLELTIKAGPKLIQRFKTFNNKRNKSVYDVAGAISDQELEAMIKLANELKDSTVVWLQKFHQELLEIS